MREKGRDEKDGEGKRKGEKGIEGNIERGKKGGRRDYVREKEEGGIRLYSDRIRFCRIFKTNPTRRNDEHHGEADSHRQATLSRAGSSGWTVRS